MLVTGVGGTGVVTLSAVLGQAAHLEGKGFGSIDMTGLAQKGGAVACHMRVAKSADQIHAIRAGVAGADLVLGCDLVVTASNKVLETIKPDHTAVVYSTTRCRRPTSRATPTSRCPARRCANAIEERAGKAPVHAFDAHTAAVKLFGDSIAANMFLLGYRLSARARADRLGGHRAGHRAQRRGGRDEPQRLPLRPAGGARPARVARADRAGAPPAAAGPQTLEDIVAFRAEQLTSTRMRRWPSATARASRNGEVEREQGAGSHRARRGSGARLPQAARLQGRVRGRAPLRRARLSRRRSGEQFEVPPQIEFHLAPPLLARRDKDTGEPRKMRFGAWMLPALPLLAKGKRLRGGAWDMFGYSAERKLERQMIADYEKLTDRLGHILTLANHATALELVRLPEAVRGFGHIKHENYERTRVRAEQLTAALETPRQPATTIRAAE